MQYICGCNKREDQIDKVTSYKIQLSAFRDYDRAMDFQYELLSHGIKTDIERSGKYYSILLKDIVSLDEAVALEQLLKRNGFNTILLS